MEQTDLSWLGFVWDLVPYSFFIHGRHSWLSGSHLLNFSAFNHIYNLYDCRVQADQRAGRAGRTCSGKCYRLYPSVVYKEEFLDVTIPEIQRSSLVGSVLYLKSLDLLDIDILKFDFLDPPSRKTHYFFNFEIINMYSQVWFSCSPLEVICLQGFYICKWAFYVRVTHAPVCLCWFMHVMHKSSVKNLWKWGHFEPQIYKAKTLVKIYTPQLSKKQSYSEIHEFLYSRSWV